MTEVYHVDLNVSNEFASEIQKESAFVSPYLSYFEIFLDENIVKFEVSDLTKIEEVKGKVASFLDAMLRAYRESEDRILFHKVRSEDSRFYENVFQVFQQRNWLYEIGPGHISLAGPPLKFISYFDSIVKKIYEDRFSVIERSFPALVPAVTLSKAGYFDSHPNNVAMMTHLVNDFDVIEKFRQNEGRTGQMQTIPLGSLAIPHICLNPAACLPCYPIYSKGDVGKGQALSWLGRVFRYESTNIRGLERLTEFNVRELVFIGTTDYVTHCQAESIKIIESLCDMFEIDGMLVTATDPFFATVAASKKLWQKSMEAKYEVKLPFEHAKNDRLSFVAAGSINNHGIFFGSRFGIAAGDDAIASSGCVGLGLERWLLACFAHHGFESNNWPMEIRNALFE